jgi:hypothetical protein
MGMTLVFGLLAVATAGDIPRQRPLVLNPALANIGYVCRWERRCMKKQELAMVRSVKYVKKYPPPAWKMSLCTRNASRRPSRVDWIGFSNCIRNAKLRPPIQQSRLVRQRRR